MNKLKEEYLKNAPILTLKQFRSSFEKTSFEDMRISDINFEVKSSKCDSIPVDLFLTDDLTSKDLKTITKTFKDTPSLPITYSVTFSLDNKVTRRQFIEKCHEIQSNVRNSLPTPENMFPYIGELSDLR
jgi:hypothetical protein